MRALAMLLAFGCAEYTTHTRILDGGQVAGHYICHEPPENAQAEVDMARELVIYYMRLIHGPIEPDYDSAPVLVCFTDETLLNDGYVGLHRGNVIWAAIEGIYGETIAIRHGALLHEFIHDVLERACLLAGCSGDPGHVDLTYWGRASVEGYAGEAFIGLP